MSKDLYLGQKVFTLKGPGKVERFPQQGKVQVKFASGPIVRTTLPLKEVWPDMRSV